MFKKGTEMYKKVAMSSWVMVLVAGCSSSEPAMNPPDDPAEVVVRSDPASTAECPNGGTVVSSGLDDNGNKVLDTSEVHKRTVLCDDAPVVPAPPVPPPPPVVVRLVAEPAGANCAEGGTAVQSGPDGNGNGTLDDGEVAHTDFVCGEVLLTRFMPEPEGSHCTAGGLAFLVGRDRDHDGVLSEAEIEHTEYECGEVLARGVTVRSSAELASLAHIRVIQGTLMMINVLADPDGTEITEVSLPALEQIGGNLLLSGDKNLARISLPALQTIEGGASFLGNSLLSTIEVPLLRRINNSLLVRGNPELRDMAGFAQLNFIGRDLVIDDNAALESARVVGTILGQIEVRDNPSLTGLTTSITDHSERIVIADNGLRTLTISASGSRNPQSNLVSVEVLNNPQLFTMRVLSNRIGRLSVTGNTVLDELELTTDQIDGDLTLTENPHVGALVIFSLDNRTGSLAIAGSLTLSGPVTDFFTRPLTIGGNLVLERTQLPWLPDIRSIGGDLRLSGNTDLTDLMPGTPSLGGGIWLIDNLALDHLFIGQLDDIRGDVIVTGNPALRSLQSLLGVVRISGNLRISDNRTMITTDADTVAVVDGSVEISNNATLSHLGLDRLTTASRILIAGNPVLAEASLPVLSGIFSVSIRIAQNDALHHVALPALTRVSQLVVQHNHQLPSCEIVELFTHIQGDFLSQSDNDDVTVCVPPGTAAGR